MNKELTTEKLTGTQKVAIFLSWLGPEDASRFFKQFTDDDIREIAICMKDLKSVDSQVLSQVLGEFSKACQADGKLVVDGDSFLKKAAKGPSDKERVQKIYEEIQKQSRGVPFAGLRGVGSEILTDLVKGEHPQTIALILAYLNSTMAADVLGRLPQNTQADVAMRIADISHVPPELIEEIENILQAEIAKAGSSGMGKINGLETLAEIMNKVDKSTEENIFTTFDEERQETANEIRQLMFVFEDILKADDKGMREILKNIETPQLVCALKTASEEMKEKMFANLSERAAAMLREDMEVAGAMKLSEVEAAQQEIVKIARQLESEGKIVIGSGGEDKLV